MNDNEVAMCGKLLAYCALACKKTQNMRTEDFKKHLCIFFDEDVVEYAIETIHKIGHNE